MVLTFHSLDGDENSEDVIVRDPSSWQAHHHRVQWHAPKDGVNNPQVTEWCHGQNQR